MPRGWFAPWSRERVDELAKGSRTLLEGTFFATISLAVGGDLGERISTTVGRFEQWTWLWMLPKERSGRCRGRPHDEPETVEVDPGGGRPREGLSTRLACRLRAGDGRGIGGVR